MSNIISIGSRREVDQDWKDEGLCAETSPDLFFPGKGEPTTPAKKICVACDVKERCLAWALETGEEYGVWGGTSENERRRMRKELGYVDEPEELAA
ncbi:WhiB family transcriptional regulator [Pseudolysinimonas sp.]|uniref:WhiB family transcriptional regulator n=1 Tax=Pseudolysinimonas sp. TaxID=2680009 RepID=UPI003F808A69